MEDPVKEETYWREQHSRQPYARKEFWYDDYAAAYRTGYEGFHKYPGKAYEEIESDLALDYPSAPARGGAAMGPCPARGPRRLGESEPRYRPARFRSRNPERDLILVATRLWRVAD